MNKFIISSIIIVLTLSFSCTSQKIEPTKETKEKAIFPKEYQAILKKGIDVDWAKTKQGIKYYNEKNVIDFKLIGLSHVRIRVTQKINDELLTHLEKIVNDCLKNDIIPIIAYQGKDFKENPTTETLQNVVNWWEAVAKHFKNYNHKLSFDIIIEVTDALNHQGDILNDLYEKAVSKIRETNPKRIIFISPRVRSAPEYLNELKIPTKSNGFLMAEWHFYASGPSKTNEKKLWTTGTETEKNLIRKRIKTAIEWQHKTKIYTWVGAWMPSDYNKGNSYTIPEQLKFAEFVACELTKNKIPSAVNSDTKFYNRETNKWIADKKPILEKIIITDCK